MYRLPLAALPLLAALAVPAGASVPPPCPIQPLVYFSSDATTTYVHVQDRRTCGAYFTVAVPFVVPPTSADCASQVLLQHDEYGNPVLVVPDPAHRCEFIRITIPLN